MSDDDEKDLLAASPLFPPLPRSPLQHQSCSLEFGMIPEVLSSNIVKTKESVLRDKCPAEEGRERSSHTPPLSKSRLF